MTEQRVVVERNGPALLVGLNRPEKRNALDSAMADELHRALDEASQEPCVIIFHSTKPGTFLAGADIAELRDRDVETTLRGVNATLFDRIAAHRWPTIAVVDGSALGGGCEFALAADLRVASTRATFGQPETSLGLIAGAGGNWRLPQLVGVGLARRMLFCGQIVDAAEAHRAGLVDEVHDPEAVFEAALSLASRISERSWRALELTKLALSLNRPATTSFDVVAQALVGGSRDTRERIQAVLDRVRHTADRTGG